MANYSPNFNRRRPEDIIRSLQGRMVTGEPGISGPLYRPFSHEEDERLTAEDEELAIREAGVKPTELYGARNAEPVIDGKPKETQTPYDRSLELYRSSVNAPVEESMGKSVLYGATNAGSRAAQSGSLGFTAGATLTGALSGLINKKLYGSAQKDANVKAAANRVEVEAAIDAQQRKRAQDEAELEGKIAGTAKTVRETELLGQPKPVKSDLKAMDGLWWVVDDTGKLSPANNPQTGKQLTQTEYDVDSQSGRIFEKRTGKVLEGAQLPRPSKITEKDIPYERFGLPDEADIKRAARARVGSSMKQRRIRPEVAANLPASFKRADGSIDEQKLWAAISSGKVDTGRSDKYGPIQDEFKLNPSQIYEDWTEKDDQALAKAEQDEDSKYKPLRIMVDDFRTRVMHNTPRPGAEQRSLADVNAALHKILQIKNQKERSKKYQELIDVLPYIEIK